MMGRTLTKRTPAVYVKRPVDRGPKPRVREASIGLGSRAVPGRQVIQDRVGQAVVDHLLRAEPLVALAVLGDLLGGLARVRGVDLVDDLAQTEHLAGLDLEIARLPLHDAGQQRLVHQVPGVGQDEPLAPRAGRGDQRAHGRRLADDVRRHVARDEAHRVDDRHARGHAAAGAVDVQADLRLGVVVGQEQELRDDEVRALVVDRVAEEDDPVVQQPREDVVGSLAAAGLLDDDGHQGGHELLALLAVRAFLLVVEALGQHHTGCLSGRPVDNYTRTAVAVSSNPTGS